MRRRMNTCASASRCEVRQRCLLAGSLSLAASGACVCMCVYTCVCMGVCVCVCTDCVCPYTAYGVHLVYI